MNRRVAWALIAGIGVLAGGLALWQACQGPPRPSGTGVLEQGPAEPLAPRRSFSLYFPGEAGLLEVETRLLPDSEEPRELVVRLVEALLAGPEAETLAPPFAAPVELAAAHLGTDGVAYVDLRTPDGGPLPGGGSLEEMLSVFSVVDTILLNVPEAGAVVLLWNGEQPESFAGHLDTSRPLAANLDLLARRP